ncbi:MAG: Kef family K(+) transporter [Rhodospirillales bacterium]|nr:Kef family K(+) transporter [Rhodospirillales bacterium]
MHTESPLISIVVVGIGLAFVLGTLANRLRTSPLAGYLLAGIAVGPFTPGFVADQSLALQLAEIGEILLMFGVGLHFSIKDLLSVRAVAVPGAIGQVAVATGLGWGLALLMGWPVSAGIVFGLCLAVASTVVLLRTLQERRLMDTRRGHVAVGWLVTQDLITVLALVLLPAFAALTHDASGSAGTQAILRTVAITLGKVAAFVALMLIVGRRAIPAVLHFVAHTGSRELFRLAVLSVALVVAWVATEVFGVSFALGAFVAGMVLSESQLSQRAAEETLPLRDAFAVLFFVSVGMLFDPTVLTKAPFGLLATMVVVGIGTPIVSFLLLRALGESWVTAATIAAGLAQVGEFSFLLADLGIALDVLPRAARDLVLGTSILLIMANPLLFTVIERARPWLERHDPTHVPAAAPQAAQAPEPEPMRLQPTRMTDHVVLVGFGRVGRLVAEGLVREDASLLVVEAGEGEVPVPPGRSVEVLRGNAADPAVLEAANLSAARLLLVAIPDAFEAGQIVEQARALRPDLRIIARAHFDAAVEHLSQHGANVVVMGEREIARSMLDWARPRLPSEDAPSAA